MRSKTMTIEPSLPNPNNSLADKTILMAASLKQSLPLFLLFTCCIFSTVVDAATGGYGTKVTRNSTYAPPTPLQQTEADVLQKSSGCVTCHVNNDLPSCLLYTSPSPRDRQKSRMPSSA